MNKSKRIYLTLVFLLIFKQYAWGGGINNNPLSRHKSRLVVGEQMTDKKNLYISFPPDLWKGVLCEASNQGYTGMLAVACVVRNRLNAGMDIGLAGMHRPNREAFVRKCGAFWQEQAKLVVNEVFIYNTKDITNGALYFESVDFPKNVRWFDRHYVRCFQYRKHIFWK